MDKATEQMKKHLRSKDGSLSWLARIGLYSVFLFVASGVVYCLGDAIVSFFTGRLEEVVEESKHFPVVILVSIFGLIFGVARFIVKTSDVKKQFKDEWNRSNEQRFERTVNLFASEDSFSKSLGLRLLGELRNDRNTSEARKDEIDSITSSGFKIESARLQRANLQGMDLRGAILENADLRDINLRGAKLQKAVLKGIVRGADLREAKLQGAVLDDTPSAKGERQGERARKDSREPTHGLSEAESKIKRQLSKEGGWFDAKFEGAEYDSETKCYLLNSHPPYPHGMKKVD